jgi:cytochrome P450
VHLEKSDLSAEDEENVKWTASALYAGGADTVRLTACLASALVEYPHLQTVSAVHIFILPMTLHPEVQARAQEQIDAVVGPDRLPTYEDRGRLPYIDALVKELFRWNPVTPFSMSPYHG